MMRNPRCETRLRFGARRVRFSGGALEPSGCDRDGDGHRDRNRDGDCHRDCNCHGHGNCHCHGDRNCYRHRDGNSHSRRHYLDARRYNQQRRQRRRPGSAGSG